MRFERGLVYTAHGHDSIDKSEQIILFVLRTGYIPLDPFTALSPETLDKMKLGLFERLGLDMRLLAHCDGLWVFGEVTYGMGKEIQWWEKHKPAWVYSAGCPVPHPTLRHVSWEELENAFNPM